MLDLKIIKLMNIYPSKKKKIYHSDIVFQFDDTMSLLYYFWLYLTILILFNFGGCLGGEKIKNEYLLSLAGAKVKAKLGNKASCFAKPDLRTVPKAFSVISGSSEEHD